MLIFGKGFYIVFVGNSVSPRSNVAIVDHMSLILTDSNLELMACPPIFLDKALKLIPFPMIFLVDNPFFWIQRFN